MLTPPLPPGFKSTPEIRVTCYPRSAIRKRESEGFVISERIGDILRPGWGDYQDQLQEGLGALNPTLDWGKHPQFDLLENVAFARLFEDGTAAFGPSRPDKTNDNSLCFAYLLPRHAPLDSKIGSTSLDGGKTDLNWVAKKGIWGTQPVIEPGGGTTIGNTGNDAVAVAETVGKIPANRSLRFKLFFLGLARTGERSQFQLVWGNRFRLTMRHDAKITVERAVIVPDAQGGQSKWQTWKTLHQGPNCNLRGGNYTVTLMRLAGRLVVSVGQFSFWMLDAQAKTNGVETEAPYSVKDVTWQEAPLNITVTNCRTRIQTGVIKWNSAAGALFTGTLKRTLSRLGSGKEVGLTSPGGWRRAGAKIDTTVAGTDGGITWTALLTASKDGIDTPCFDRIVGRAVPEWSGESAPGVNLARAVTRAQVSLAMPPLLAGTEITLELDLWLLTQIPNWQNVTRARCPVDVSIRWGYDNGAKGAWSRVLSGYILKPAQEVNGYASGSVQLILRDPIMRLQKPAAIVDHKFPPLELLFLERLGANPNGGYGDDGMPIMIGGETMQNAALYGAECVQELLRIQLGDEVADAMNGNGDAKRFLPDFQPPLLSSKTDTCGYLQVAELFGASSESAPSLLSGNWIFPPPFGDDVLSWINKFAADDFAICFFGWPDGDTGQPPVFIYGNYDILIANRRLVTLPDTSPNGNPHRLLTSIAIETRPDKTFNRFLVWGNLGGGTSGLEGLVPALRMAEARFAPSDPESAENSWELTDLIQNNIAAATGGIPGRGAAEAIALARKNGVEGVQLEWPSFTFHGDATIQLGDVVQPQLTPANQALGLHGETLNGARYRIERIEHALSWTGSATFETTVYARPLSGTGSSNSQTMPPIPGGDDPFVVAG